MRASRFRATRVEKVAPLRLGRLMLRALTAPGQIPGAQAVHVRLPAGCGHDEVVHRRTKEWFLVLRGTGRGRIDGRAVSFRPGVAVYMPPGVPHRMRAGSSALEALAIFSPPLAPGRPGADLHPVRRRRAAARRRIDRRRKRG